jgi:MFS transporter, ACDE family, multidrug resistance protein
MEWSRSGMFLTTAGLTLLCAVLSMMLIHVAKKEPSKESDSLFEKLSFT